MMKLKTKKIHGFTLIEILVALTILGFVVTIGSNFLVTGFKSIRFDSEQGTAIKIARDSMSLITKDVRGANSSVQGAYALNKIDTHEFIYFCDVDQDNQTEKIQYILEDNNLKKVLTEPGPSNDYTGAISTTTLANYMNNQTEPIFTYFDSDNSTTSNINEVRMININLKINVTPEIAPNDVYVETDIHLRNLKDNL